MQSKRSSLTEATVNVVVGYVLGTAVWFVLSGGKIGESVIGPMIMTVLSFARSYVIRRMFNRNANS